MSTTPRSSEEQHERLDWHFKIKRKLEATISRRLRDYRVNYSTTITLPLVDIIQEAYWNGVADGKISAFRKITGTGDKDTRIERLPDGNTAVVWEAD
jgi:hypothetical protein